MLNIENFMQQKVEADTSYNFRKLYAFFGLSSIMSLVVYCEF